jgi:hypothetical protein
MTTTLLTLLACEIIIFSWFWHKTIGSWSTFFQILTPCSNKLKLADPITCSGTWQTKPWMLFLLSKADMVWYFKHQLVHQSTNQSPRIPSVDESPMGLQKVSREASAEMEQAAKLFLPPPHVLPCLAEILLKLRLGVSDNFRPARPGFSSVASRSFQFDPALFSMRTSTRQHGTCLFQPHPA